MDGVMTLLSLGEAAEQAAVSKADVWGAIQDGSLPAEKTGGGYAIDSADLARVFGGRRTAPEAAPEPPLPPPARKADEASAKPAAADDVAAAFAALGAELKNLLGDAPHAKPSREDGLSEHGEGHVDPTPNAAEAVPAEKVEVSAVQPPAPPAAPAAAARQPWWRRWR